MVPEFEAAGLRHGARRDPRPDQDAVRIPHHQARLEDARRGRARSTRRGPQLAAELSERQATAEVDRHRTRALREAQEDVFGAPTRSCASSRRDVVNLNTTEWAAKGDPIPGIGANQKFADEAWRLSVGKVSATPVTTARGIVFVKASEERAAGLPPFAELKPRLEQDWKAERREKDALAQLEPAAKELSAGATLAALAPRYGTEVKTTTEFGPGGPVPEIGAAPELVAAVFQTPQGQAGPPVAVPTGFVLFRVLTRTEGRPRRLAGAEGTAARDRSAPARPSA